MTSTFVPEPTWVPPLELMEFTAAILDETTPYVTSREMTTQTTVELLCRMAEHPMFSNRLKFTPQGFVLFPENSMVMEGQDPTRP